MWATASSASLKFSQCLDYKIFHFCWQSHRVYQEIVTVNHTMTEHKDYLRQSSKQCLF